MLLLITDNYYRFQIRLFYWDFSYWKKKYFRWYIEKPSPTIEIIYDVTHLILIKIFSFYNVRLSFLYIIHILRFFYYHAILEKYLNFWWYIENTMSYNWNNT